VIAERQIISDQLNPLQRSINSLSELANKQANIASQAVTGKDDNDTIVTELLARKLAILDRAAQIVQETEEFGHALRKTVVTLTGKLTNE